MIFNYSDDTINRLLLRFQLLLSATLQSIEQWIEDFQNFFLIVDENNAVTLYEGISILELLVMKFFNSGDL